MLHASASRSNEAPRLARVKLFASTLSATRGSDQHPAIVFHVEIHYDTDMNVACPLCRSGDTFVLQTTEPVSDSDPLVMTTFIAPV
jgi:hypothetical protein